MPTTSASKTIIRDPSWLGPAVSPGEMLLEEFIKPLGLRQTDAARQLGISLNRLNEVVRGRRRITADTAIRLSSLLQTSPQFWMRLQADWDLHQALAPVVEPGVAPRAALECSRRSATGCESAPRRNLRDGGTFAR